MIKANFHTHTTLCDGSDSPESITAYALRSNMTHLGFSGHMDTDIHMDVEKYYREIRRLQDQNRGRLDILRGIELDILYDPACLYDAEYWIGSVHFLDVESEVPPAVDVSPELMQRLCTEHFGGDYYALARAYYRLAAQVYDRTRCTFVGHFDLVTRFNDQMHFFDETDPRYLNPALEAMEYLVRQGVPFEINTGAFSRGRKADVYPALPLLKALHDFGGQILISADAHQKELLTGGFALAREHALQCGFTHVLILEHDPYGKIVPRSIPLDQFQT